MQEIEERKQNDYHDTKVLSLLHTTLAAMSFIAVEDIKQPVIIRVYELNMLGLCNLKELLLTLQNYRQSRIAILDQIIFIILNSAASKILTKQTQDWFWRSICDLYKYLKHVSSQIPCNDLEYT